MENLGDEMITKQGALEELSDSFIPPGEEEYCKKYNRMLVDAIFGEANKMTRDEYDDLREQKECLDLIHI